MHKTCCFVDNQLMCLKINAYYFSLAVEFLLNSKNVDKIVHLSKNNL